MNVTARLEYELVYYDSAVHCFNHYTTRTSTESLLIATQNNRISTNHIKASIDKTQQNRKCMLCGDWDETINHIICEHRKLTQKEYKTRHYWVGKMNCARNFNLIMRTNGICTTQHHSWRMLCINSSGILTSKRIS